MIRKVDVGSVFGTAQRTSYEYMKLLNEKTNGNFRTLVVDDKDGLHSIPFATHGSNVVMYEPNEVYINGGVIDDITTTPITNRKYFKENEVTGIKAGTTSFNIVSTDGKVNKKVKVVIRKSNYKVTKKDGIYYIDGIMIVNKSYPISKDYAPKDILPDTKNAYEKMKKADTFSARPGYSEHQTGYVMDLNDATSNFEGTKAAKWLDKNAYKYGFIIRFPKGKEKYTGYKYEPWHVRYIGVEKALKIYKSGLGLEEYYNLKSEYKDD